MNAWVERQVEDCAGVAYVELRGKDFLITIEPRPRYCDRGNHLAKIHGQSKENPVDGQDGWPRYYFDLERAKLECEAWLTKRGQRT